MFFSANRQTNIYSIRPAEIAIWTDRDYQVLNALCRQLAIVEIEQMRRLWYRDSSTSAIRRRMRKLAQFGLVDRFIMNAHPLLSASRPLLSWEPDCVVPDAEEVACQARERWHQTSVPMEVFVAGRRASNQFGAPYLGLLSAQQRNAGLLLTQAFIYELNRNHDAKERWVRKDVYADSILSSWKANAFLVWDETPIHVISAETSTKEQIRSIYKRCAAAGISFDIW